MARHRRTAMPTPPAGGGYEFEIVNLNATDGEGPAPAVKARGGLVPVTELEIENETVRTRVEKCSEGVAVIVPAALAAQAGLSAGPAELAVMGGRVIVRKVGDPKLADLLPGVKSENLNGERNAELPVEDTRT